MGSSIHKTGTDTWVGSAKPSATNERGSWLRCQNPGTATEYSFIRTNSPIPLHATVTSVKLHLYGIGNWGAGAVQVSVQRAAAAWTDSKLTYNNRPGVTGTVVSVTQTNTVDATEWVFDLTAVWQTIVNGQGNYGLRISTSDTVEHKFYSFQASDNRPWWDFEWSDAPDTPTELSPAGGASITLQKPVVTFNFHDVSGSTAMGACQVQVNPTNLFTAPAFDSGTVLTSDPELDLSLTFPRSAASVVTTSASTAISAPAGTFTVGSDVGATIVGTGIPAGATLTAVASDTAATLSAAATASGTITATLTRSYAGLAVGSTAWWRVRVQDASGLWSSWSDPTSFKRVARGALTLSSPTGGVITDPTQLVIWALTGATQTAWQVFIADNNNPTERITDTGRRSGTATSWTIPKGVITDESTTYRLTVRTWDDVSRTAAPNDKIHTEVITNFSFQSSGTVDPVTALTATGRPNGQPGMVLQWTRATAPDHYEIRRGTPGAMKVIDTDLDPASLIVSGTTYQYIDRTALAYQSQTWRVVCKTSTGTQYGPTVTGQFNLVTTWLEDITTGKMVPILFRDGSDGVTNFDAPQIAVVAQANSAKHITRYVQGQAGLQGSCSGVIDDFAGDVADNWRKNMEWMRDHPDNQLRLSTQGMNLNVIIGDVVLPPYKRGGTNARLVSFNWWEQ